MTRLTDALKSQIVKSCLTAQFQKQSDELSVAEHDIAMQLYHELFDKKTLAAIKKLPEKWFRMDGCLMFNCNGYRLTLNVNKPVPVPYATSCSPLGSPSAELAGIAITHSQNKEKYRERYNEAYRALKGMLDSVSTIKQLANTWPEGEPFYKEYLSPTAPSLPAVQVSKINELLNLKPIKKGK